MMVTSGGLTSAPRQRGRFRPNPDRSRPQFELISHVGTSPRVRFRLADRPPAGDPASGFLLSGPRSDLLLFPPAIPGGWPPNGRRRKRRQTREWKWVRPPVQGSAGLNRDPGLEPDRRRHRGDGTSRQGIHEEKAGPDLAERSADPRRNSAGDSEQAPTGTLSRAAAISHGTLAGMKGSSLMQKANVKMYGPTKLKRCARVRGRIPQHYSRHRLHEILCTRAPCSRWPWPAAAICCPRVRPAKAAACRRD